MARTIGRHHESVNYPPIHSIAPPRHGHRVTIYDNSGKRLALLGADDEGEESGAFIAPHGMGVDSSGNIYVGEVSFTIRGSHMDPPKELRSFTKLAKVS